MLYPKNVLAWREFHDWGPIVQDLVNDIVTQDVINAVKAAPPEYCYYEDVKWLQRALDIAGIHVKKSVVGIIAERLPNVYSHVRMYHACRPVNIKSYYQHGFIPADPKSLNELAEKYFLWQPRVTKEILDKAIRVAEDQRRGGVVCFALDDRILTTIGRHYLINGSEYIAVVAHELQRQTGEDYPAQLTAIGTPTIFVCNLPIENVKPILHELSGGLLESLFEAYVRPQSELAVIDLTLSIPSNIPPSAIVRHYYPLMPYNEG